MDGWMDRQTHGHTDTRIDGYNIYISYTDLDIIRNDHSVPKLMLVFFLFLYSFEAEFI